MASRLHHPFERIPAGRRRRVMLGLLIPTLSVMAALIVLDGPLRTAASPNGIISFELCAFDHGCDAVIAAFGGARLAAGASLGLDYLYMPLYASTLAAALVFATARKSDRVRAIAAGLAWGALIAPGFDAVENVALYRMLATGHAPPALAWTAGVAASVKFTLVIAAIVAIPILALRPRRRDPA